MRRQSGYAGRRHQQGAPSTSHPGDEIHDKEGPTAMRSPRKGVLILGLAVSLAANLLSIRLALRLPQDKGSTVKTDGRDGRSSSRMHSINRTTTQYPEQFCVETTRCARLERTGAFSFVHISKSGGQSWISELKGSELGTLYPRKTYGPEHSVAFQATVTKRPYNHLWYHLTSLRSPRHHTWSLWSQCRFSGWGEQVTRNTRFPRGGNDTQGDVRDFAEWMNRFVDDESRSLRPSTYRSDEWYNCYHPANYQSRPLVSAEKNPHGVERMVGLVPDVRTATQTYWYMDWVAVTEFFHESKCLLYYRMSPRTERMQRYLDQSCRCRAAPPSNDDDEGHDQNRSDRKKVSSLGRGRDTMRDLSPDLLEIISVATRVDVRLYRTALIQFMEEVAWLERSLSRRVLCEEVLREWEPELAYLNLSVTELYNEKDRHFPL